MTDQQPDQQPTNNRPTTDHKQECKKEKNKEYNGDFETWYSPYPRKDGSKAEALKAYLKAIHEGATHETLVTGLGRFIEFCRATNAEQRYIAHAATWLNQKRWEGDYSAKPSSFKSAKPKRPVATGRHL